MVVSFQLSPLAFVMEQTTPKSSDLKQQPSVWPCSGLWAGWSWVMLPLLQLGSLTCLIGVGPPGPGHLQLGQLFPAPCGPHPPADEFRSVHLVAQGKRESQEQKQKVSAWKLHSVTFAGLDGSEPSKGSSDSRAGGTDPVS